MNVRQVVPIDPETRRGQSEVRQMAATIASGIVSNQLVSDLYATPEEDQDAVIDYVANYAVRFAIAILKAT